MVKCLNFIIYGLIYFLHVQLKLTSAQTSFLSLQSKEEMEMYFRGVIICSLLALWSKDMNAFQDGQPMRFETPKMNEEEQHSIHTPTSFEMTCDACTAIAYQVSLM